MNSGAARSKRVVAAPVMAESAFHQTRTQEQLRTNALTTQNATEQQMAPSYFTASLQEMAAQRLADSFAEHHEVDALREEHPELYAMILERLPTAPETMLPLRITVPRIVEERYWRRCCEARWPLGQLSRMVAEEKLREKEYGWKRLFLEQVLSDFLMSLGSQNTSDGSLLPSEGLSRLASNAAAKGPTAARAAAVMCTARDADAGRFDLSLDETAMAALRELCVICRDYVHTIDLPCQLVHLHLYEHLFAHVPGILSFRLTYNAGNRGVRVGVTDMIGFNDADAAEVRQLLRHYTFLETLRLPLNRLQDRHVQMIAAGLVDLLTLRVLDLSQNSLTDAAVVDAVAVLLGRPDFPLEELCLNDNMLGDAAALAIAEALAVNKTLRVLHLQQNGITDAVGGVALVRALTVQPTLTDVNVGHNQLGLSTIEELVEALPELTQLRVLGLAGNTRMTGAIRQLNAPASASAVTATGVGSSFPSSRLPAGSTSSLPLVTLKEDVGENNDTVAGAAASVPGAAEASVYTGISGLATAGSAADESRPPSTAAGTPKSVRTARPSITAAITPSSVKESNSSKEENTSVAPAVVPTFETEGGIALAAAVQSNTSLIELDVRLCGFAPLEEEAMMGGVQQRVFLRKMETTVAASDAEQRRELKRRAEEKVARMTGRVL